MTANKIVAIAFLCLLVPGVQARQTMYIIDHLIITMRAGPDTHSQVVGTLSSGATVEVVKTDEATGYSQVRNSKGVEGWVRSQYLSNIPINKVRLVEVETRLAAITSGNKRLITKNRRQKQQLDKLREEKAQLKTDWKKLSVEGDKLTRKLIQARKKGEHPPKFAEESKRFKTEILNMEKEIKMLRQENQVIKDQSDTDWFLAGAGVLMIGLIVGFIVPRSRGGKKSSWDNL